MVVCPVLEQPSRRKSQKISRQSLRHFLTSFIFSTPPHNAYSRHVITSSGFEIEVMASPELSAHLRYLNESAHLLATAAPETSRHLMSRHNALLFANQIEVEGTQRKSACGACGALVVPGWEGTLESHIERSKVSKKRKPVERTVQKRAMVYECGICGKKTWETV
ncbi:uncharacterized protein LY89DRAFT_679986, partial [Mollisia scopiformis]